MFLSISDDEIFQAALSNIENIINLFKYANQRRDMKMRCLRFIKGLPMSEDFISNFPAIWHKRNFGKIADQNNYI
jgi:hypothetical protein